jgi:hypothetical protein
MLPMFAELGFVELADDCPKANELFGYAAGFENDNDNNNNNDNDDNDTKKKTKLLFKPCRRQFVVKAQSYKLKPGQSYSGHWHLEGF